MHTVFDEVNMNMIQPSTKRRLLGKNPIKYGEFTYEDKI